MSAVEEERQREKEERRERFKCDGEVWTGAAGVRGEEGELSKSHKSLLNPTT